MGKERREPVSSRWCWEDYVLTGSLWVPMLLHAWLDINAGFIAHLDWEGTPKPQPA